MSWDFSRKEEYDDIVKNWKMIFQASDLKSKYFLNLLDDKHHTIESSYTKGGSWIRYFSHSNMLCARMT